MSTKALNQWLTDLETTPTQDPANRFVFCRKLARQLGLGARRYFLITIGGTNGKGSCVATLERIFLEQGYRVGSFTSPHLYYFNERIRLNGQSVSNDILLQAFQVIERYRRGKTLGYFAFATLAALWIFQEQALDIVLLEVGIGGRLDTTNIIDTDLAVITNVSLDHCDRLGEDRTVIGREKAGILRFKRPLVYGELDIPWSIVSRAHELNAPIFKLGRDYHIQQCGGSWQWQGRYHHYAQLPYPRLALENVAAGLQVYELMCPSQPLVSVTLRRLLKNLELCGRWQKWPGPPVHWFDVAHNPQAAQLLQKKLKKINARLIAVAGFQSHKLIEATIKPLRNAFTAWYIGELNDRHTMAARYTRLFNTFHLSKYTIYPTIEAAHRDAFDAAGNDDNLIVFGSFQTVARVWKQVVGVTT